jgi:hypothetical protein
MKLAIEKDDGVVGTYYKRCLTRQLLLLLPHPAAAVDLASPDRCCCSCLVIHTRGN